MLSIVIPIYNSERWLGTCLDSISRQSIRDYELILVDDGSTDGSLAICKSYALKDNRIKVISKNNEGVSIARNTGIYAATGEYICFIDSDDYIEPLYLEHLLNDASANDSDLVFTGRVLIRINGVSEYLAPPTQKYTLKESKDIFLNPAFDWVRGGPVGKLFRLSVIKENNIAFPSGIQYLEDAIFVMDFIKHSKVISAISYSEYVYKLHEGSLVFSTGSFESEKEAFDLFFSRYEELCFFYNLKGNDDRWFVDNLMFLIYRQRIAINNSNGIISRVRYVSSIDWTFYLSHYTPTGLKGYLRKAIESSSIIRRLLAIVKKL